MIDTLTQQAERKLAARIAANQSPDKEAVELDGVKYVPVYMTPEGAVVEYTDLRSGARVIRVGFKMEQTGSLVSFLADFGIKP